MAHLVADAVGRPAQRDLAKVAGADDEAAALVGEAEQIVGAKARLHVLEGDVVDRLALGERDGPCRRASAARPGVMSISSPTMPSAFISAQALPLVSSPVAKPGMVKPRMVERGRPRRSQALAATIRAWVESSPPETPMTRCSPLRRLEAADQALDLDVERLVAILVELLGPVGDVGEAAQRALEADVGEAGLVLEADACGSASRDGRRRGHCR